MCMYHERQSRQLCLQHTLNNILQKPEFSQKDLNRIAGELSPGHSFLSVLGSQHFTRWIGNYDVSVLEVALSSQGKVRRIDIVLCSTDEKRIMRLPVYRVVLVSNKFG